MKITKFFIILVILITLTSCSLFEKPGFISISNNSSVDEIWYVYIVLSTSGTWGNDKLGGLEIIGTNSTKVFELDADTYDVKIEVYENNIYIGFLYLHDIMVEEDKTKTLIFNGTNFYPIN